MTRTLLAEIALREALRSLDEAIVALWAAGTRSQGEIGRHVGLDQRSVSRRIARMVRRGAWPFDAPQHLLLNIAVGGNWGGQQGVDDTTLPYRFIIDYVRVYQRIPAVVGGGAPQAPPRAAP